MYHNDVEHFDTEEYLDAEDWINAEECLDPAGEDQKRTSVAIPHDS